MYSNWHSNLNPSAVEKDKHTRRGSHVARTVCFAAASSKNNILIKSFNRYVANMEFSIGMLEGILYYALK